MNDQHIIDFYLHGIEPKKLNQPSEFACKLPQVVMKRKQWDKIPDYKQEFALTRFDVILDFKTFREKAVAFAWAVNMKNLQKTLDKFNQVMDQFDKGMDKAGLGKNSKDIKIFDDKKSVNINIFGDKEDLKKRLKI